MISMINTIRASTYGFPKTFKQKEDSNFFHIPHSLTTHFKDWQTSTLPIFTTFRKTRDCFKFIILFTILWISYGLTTWLSYLWVRKCLRVYIDIIATSRSCLWRYFVTYMTMIHSFSFSIRLLRVGPYCNYNRLYYYSSERVTRAGWELLTIYLRWNPLTRSLTILLMRFSTWWTVCSTTRVVSCDAFIFGRVIAHVQQLLPNAYQRSAYMLPIQHKASPIHMTALRSSICTQCYWYATYALCAPPWKCYTRRYWRELVRASLLWR